MPYIPQDERERLAGDAPALTPGELNYCLTWHLLNTDPDDMLDALWKEVMEYVLNANGGPNYETYNAVMGAITCCHREFVRRGGPAWRPLAVENALGETADRVYDQLIAPYEDAKIQQNGDVYQ